LPNIKSAAKRDEVSKMRNARNRAERSALRTNLKKFNAAVLEGDRETVGAMYKLAVASVDRAASKNILHKNNAARKKSAMTLKLNSIEK
jgi:small subunit ribosomal protein S20